MFILLLLGLAIAGALSGWLIGRLRYRRWWLTMLVVLLPFWLYACLIPVFALSGNGWSYGLALWLAGLLMAGLLLLSWIIPAAAVFAITRFGDQMAGNLRAP